MGKQGPCYHCGITSTPLWRNGPPEKPVLCNACGSRWRTKGSLANYIPIHARVDFVKPEDSKISKPKTFLSKKGPKSKKNESLEASVEANGELTSQSDQNFKQILEEDVSNRSSSNSAVSYSESCAYICNVDGSDMTGTAQSVVWDTLVPSKKRTCSRKPSSVEKLAKDLCNILQEQQLSSQFSSPSEEDLLFESRSPLDTFEIGHGGCLIKYINSNFQEESDASSSVYSKSQTLTETHIGSQDLANLKRKGINAPFVEDRKVKKLNFEAGQDSMRRDNLPDEKLAVLSSNSPLVSVDLRVIVNHEEFLRHLNYEEQQGLMKHLPPSDVANLPYSLKSMFESRQFLETLSSFQQLLREGIFDMPCMGIANTKYRILRRLLLSSFAKSKWIEHYQQNKDAERKKTDYSVRKGLQISVRHNQDHDFTAPRPQFSCGNSKTINAETEASHVRERNIIPFPNDGRSSIMGSFQFSDESSNKDLLNGILSNASTPEAKPLSCHKSKLLSTNGTEASNSHDVPSNESSSTLTSQATSTSMAKHPHNPKTKSMLSLPSHL